MALLAVFTIFNRSFVGGFSATWSGIMHQPKREKPTLDTGHVFGLLAGSRGLGTVISGPISSALINPKFALLATQSDIGYETQYRWLIVFSGATALLSGWGCTWRIRRSVL